MKKIITLCATAMLFAPAAAYADDATGFYGSLAVGGASVNNVDATVFAPAGQIFGSVSEESVSAASVPTGSDTIGGKFKLKDAFAISGSLGYDFGLVRTDVEVSYARNKVKSFTITKLTSGSATGVFADDPDSVCAYLETSCPAGGNTVDLGGSSKLRQLNAMANVWLDIPVSFPVEPYVGGGLGVAGFELDGEGKARFAWQIGGGVAYKISPKIALTADVRYRQANGTTLNDAGYGTVIGKIKTVNYGLGLRVGF